MKSIRPPNRCSNPSRRQASRGLSLIEALCACSVTVTALGLSVGGLHGLADDQRLRSAAAELETEIQLARSVARLGTETVRLAVQPMAGGSCKLVHTGDRDACQCNASGVPVCTGGAEVLHLNHHDASTGVRITTGDLSLAFSAARGTVTPTATVKLSDRNGRALHHVVNVMGRVRTCSPAGAVNGFKPC